MFPFLPKAQEKDAVSIKQKTISEARYLKSIYETDKAITLLSGLLRPDCFDEELLSELADCHMQDKVAEQPCEGGRHHHSERSQKD